LVENFDLSAKGPRYSERQYDGGYPGPSGLELVFGTLYQGDVLRFASHLPLAFIFRAFGAAWSKAIINLVF
jgi:hypothetical protein